jgi:hypothetical protein
MLPPASSVCMVDLVYCFFMVFLCFFCFHLAYWFLLVVWVIVVYWILKSLSMIPCFPSFNLSTVSLLLTYPPCVWWIIIKGSSCFLPIFCFLLFNRFLWKLNSYLSPSSPVSSRLYGGFCSLLTPCFPLFLTFHPFSSLLHQLLHVFLLDDWLRIAMAWFYYF